MVFQNASHNYPIRGIPDNLPGGSHRSGPNGWIDTGIMPEWLREEQPPQALPRERSQIFYVDNCLNCGVGGHEY